MKYRNCPKVIDAEQYELSAHRPKGICFCSEGRAAHVHTIQGQRVNVKYGEWIVDEGDGKHFYPIAPEVFAKSYEPAE